METVPRAALPAAASLVVIVLFAVPVAAAAGPPATVPLNPREPRGFAAVSAVGDRTTRLIPWASSSSFVNETLAISGRPGFKCSPDSEPCYVPDWLPDLGPQGPGPGSLPSIPLLRFHGDKLYAYSFDFEPERWQEFLRDTLIDTLGQPTTSESGDGQSESGQTFPQELLTWRLEHVTVTLNSRESRVNRGTVEVVYRQLRRPD